MNIYTIDGRLLLKVTGDSLTGADLCGADLRGAFLIGTNLRGADMAGAAWTPPYKPKGKTP